MSIFNSLFSSSSNGKNVKVKEKNSDKSIVRGDIYTKTNNGHVHRGYNLDKSSGSYREYHGGENSEERSYNKK